MEKLNEQTIRQLGSYQVILSTDTVVKELLENAIDAKAAHIKIRLVHSGLKGITVVDNGTGLRKVF